MKPDYENSTLNLVASIQYYLGKKPKYKPLKNIDLSKIKDSRNIIFLVIDGLGYEFLMKYGQGTILNKNIKGKITSTFPTSTSAAMTALSTGLSPQEIGMSGWYMYLKEFGSQIISLPY